MIEELDAIEEAICELLADSSKGSMPASMHDEVTLQPSVFTSELHFD